MFQTYSDLYNDTDPLSKLADIFSLLIKTIEEWKFGKLLMGNMIVDFNALLSLKLIVRHLHMDFPRYYSMLEAACRSLR